MKKENKEKIEKKQNVWQINYQGFLVFHQLCPNFLLIEILSCVFSGIYPYFNIYMTAEIVTRLSKGERNIYPLILFTVVGNFAISILRQIFANACVLKNRLFIEELDRQMTIKVQTMDYQDIENPKVQKLRKKILEDMRMNGRGTGAFIDGVCSIARNLTSILIVAGFFIERKDDTY